MRAPDVSSTLPDTLAVPHLRAHRRRRAHQQCQNVNHGDLCSGQSELEIFTAAASLHFALTPGTAGHQAAGKGAHSACLIKRECRFQAHQGILRSPLAT